MKCSGCGGEFPDYETECPVCRVPLTASPFDMISSFSAAPQASDSFAVSSLFDEAAERPVEGHRGAVRIKADGSMINLNCPVCMNLIFVGDRAILCKNCDTIYHEHCFPRSGCNSPLCSEKRTVPEKSPPEKADLMKLQPEKTQQAKPRVETKKISEQPPKPLPQKQTAAMEPVSPPSRRDGTSRKNAEFHMGIAAEGGILSAYIGSECPVCGNSIFNGDEIYLCKGCEKAYHKWCFNAGEGCPSPQCGGGGIVRSRPVAPVAAANRTAAAIYNGGESQAAEGNPGKNAVLYGVLAFVVMIVPCVGCFLTPLFALLAIQKGSAAKLDPQQASMGSSGEMMGKIALIIYGLLMLFGLLGGLLQRIFH